MQNLDAVKAADVVVCVTGMDGGLASVVAGLVEVPVIALPTSTGARAVDGVGLRLAPVWARVGCRARARLPALAASLPRTSQTTLRLLTPTHPSSPSPPPAPTPLQATAPPSRA